MIKRVVSISILVIAFIGNLGASDHSIAFVHIGKKFPDYLKDALEQARLFNHECPIYLVANQEAVAQADAQEREVLSVCNITVVYCETLPMSNSHRRFIKNTPLDKNYRDGFWLRASERFFYLDELIKQYNLKHVVHLESDNMLYVDIGTLMPVFKEYQHIGAVYDCDERIIPSIVYIASFDSIHPLVRFMANNASKGLSDMYVMAAFRTQFGRGHLDTMPIIMREYRNVYQFTNSFRQTVADPEMYSNKVEKFNSVFDAAALGQYFGGIDPRNGPSQPGWINELNIYNPSHLTYDWIVDEEGRKVPYMVFQEKRYRINNLHVHSKNLKAFKS